MTRENITHKLKLLFQTEHGLWRSDGHLGIAWLQRQFHSSASRLTTRPEFEAPYCSAIVKIYAILAQMMQSESTQTLVDTERLLNMLYAYAPLGDVSTYKEILTEGEERSAQSVLRELALYYEQLVLTASKGRAFAPMIGSLTMPPRRAGIHRRAGALGVIGRLIETREDEFTDRFIEANTAAY